MKRNIDYEPTPDFWDMVVAILLCLLCCIDWDRTLDNLLR